METFRVTENYFSIEKLRNFLLIEEKRQTKGIRHFLAESEHRLSSLPILIQLSIHPDEIYSFETIESLTKFDFEFSLNVFDSFRSNLLMFTIRFQRLRLFEYFLNELFFHFDFRSKDRRGNTILHYSVIYFPDDLRLFELLIDKFNENHLEIDPRNSFGFTPLILAMFCGRYDVVLLLLQRTNTSPFARDEIFFRNLFDYFRISSKKPKKSFVDRRFARFSLELHQSIPSRHEKVFLHQTNFFQRVLPQIVDDRSDSLRSTLFQIFQNENSSIDREYLRFYLHGRFPSISSFENENSSNLLTKFHLTKPNSKENLQKIFESYEENPRPKAFPPLNSKPPISTFKNLSLRLSMITLVSRPLANLRTTISLPTNDEK